MTAKPRKLQPILAPPLAVVVHGNGRGI